MNDTVSRETRSRVMASVRSKNTKPEMYLRKLLFARGFRYRLHSKNLVGTPDLVFRGLRAVCFVHGCFWHRHEGCKNASAPSSRREYWVPKFDKTIRRDRKTRENLLRQGWRVAIVWECSLQRGRAESTVNLLERWLLSDEQEFETTLV